MKILKARTFLFDCRRSGKMTALKHDIIEVLQSDNWCIYKDASRRHDYQYKYDQKQKVLIYQAVTTKRTYYECGIDIEEAAEYVINGKLEPLFGG